MSMRPVGRDFENKSVLYLEDEVLIALDVKFFLRDSGFSEIAIAHKLQDAWSAQDQSDFDLALLDINVDKDQSSIELGEQLRLCGTKVVFISGNGSDRARLEERGFCFIGKPFTHRALEHELHKAFASPATLE